MRNLSHDPRVAAYRRDVELDQPVYARVSFDVKARHLAGLLLLVLLIYASVTEVHVLLIWPLLAALLPLTALLLVLRSRNQQLQSVIDRQRATPDMAPAAPTRLDRVRLGNPEAYIGDKERDAIIELIHDQYVRGCITKTECDARAACVIQARRRGDLIPAMLDLEY